MTQKLCANCGCDKKEHGNSYCILCGWSRCRKFKSKQRNIIDKKKWDKLVGNRR